MASEGFADATWTRYQLQSLYRRQISGKQPLLVAGMGVQGQLGAVLHRVERSALVALCSGNPTSQLNFSSSHEADQHLSSCPVLACTC